ncbi:MAG: hypothetical protein U0K59_03420 [Bacteroidales bacterium]|nr:hypothetical protein [Bacteroidales bacterium]
MRRKNWLLLLSLGLIFTSTTFIACNEDDTEDEIIINKSITAQEEIIIAKYHKDSTNIELLFDIDSVILHTEQLATRYALTPIAIEEISILDKNPHNLNSFGYVRCNSFLLSKGVSKNFIIKLIKYIDEETGDVLYKLASNARISGSCESNDNCKGEGGLTGCVARVDDNDNFIGCSLCTNEEGRCKESSKTDSILDKIITAIFSALKTNVNINIK